MSKIRRIDPSEPRPWHVFTPSGHVDSFIAASMAESFARAASQNSTLVYGVFHQTNGGQLRKWAEFRGGRKLP